MTAEQQTLLIDEINRKALETLERILNDHSIGMTSRASAVAALNTLFSTVSGLVSEETFQLISEASKELTADKAIDRMRRLYIDGKGTLVSVEFVYGDTHVTVRSRVPSEASADWSKVAVTSFSDELVPFEAAKARMDHYDTALLRQGYRALA